MDSLDVNEYNLLENRLLRRGLAYIVRKDNNQSIVRAKIILWVSLFFVDINSVDR